MARRRPPEVDTDLALDTPAPNWLARQVWIHRWGQEYRGPQPESYAQAWRTVLNAGPLEPHLERAQQYWGELDDDQRRQWWEHDDGPNHCPGCQPCKRHKQAVAFCDQDCPTVVRLQAAEDGENTHYWNGTAG